MALCIVGCVPTGPCGPVTPASSRPKKETWHCVSVNITPKNLRSVWRTIRCPAVLHCERSLWQDTKSGYNFVGAGSFPSRTPHCLKASAATTISTSCLCSYFHNRQLSSVVCFCQVVWASWWWVPSLLRNDASAARPAETRDARFESRWVTWRLFPWPLWGKPRRPGQCSHAFWPFIKPSVGDASADADDPAEDCDPLEGGACRCTNPESDESDPTGTVPHLQCSVHQWETYLMSSNSIASHENHTICGQRWAPSLLPAPAPNGCRAMNCPTEDFAVKLGISWPPLHRLPALPCLQPVLSWTPTGLLWTSSSCRLSTSSDAYRLLIGTLVKARFIMKF